MENSYTSEEAVKKELQISSFNEMDEKKFEVFKNMFPLIDKDVAISIINQLPDYLDKSGKVFEQLRLGCDKALESNDPSNKEAIEAYKMVLTAYDEAIKDGTISAEEKIQLLKGMEGVADKVSDKDTENKQFIKEVVKSETSTADKILTTGAILGGLAAIGGALWHFKNKKD